MLAAIDPSLIVPLALVQAALVLLLIALLDCYEREPVGLILLAALWGATGAALVAAPLDSALLEELPFRTREVWGPAIVAPPVEEIAKGAALLVAAIASHRFARRSGAPVFEGVNDGIVYGSAIGLGFAFSEDLTYLVRDLSRADADVPAAIHAFTLRRDFGGLGVLPHAVCTSIFGAALGWAVWTRPSVARVVVPVAGLLGAIVLHAAFNGLPTLVLGLQFGFEETEAFVTGFGLAIPADVGADMQAVEDGVATAMELTGAALLVGAMWWWLAVQRRVLERQLAEEVRTGLITTAELEAVVRPRLRLRRDLALLRGADFNAVRRERRRTTELVDLAFLKRRGLDGCANERRATISRLPAGH